MILLTREALAAMAVPAFARRYKGLSSYYTETIRQLEALGSTPNPDDVDRIIGNASWTRLKECDECKITAVVVELGEGDDCESNTACVCVDCLRKALALIEAKREARG